MTMTLNRKDLEPFRRLCTKTLQWRRNASGWCHLTPCPDGVTLTAASMDAVVRCVIPCDYADEPLVLPWEAVTELASKKDAPVTFTLLPASRAVRAEWQESCIPRSAVYHLPKTEMALPEMPSPDEWAENRVELLAALETCSRVTGEPNALRALHCVALRPDSGSLVATDGLEILIVGGFVIPGHTQLLLPASGVFSCPELRERNRVSASENTTQTESERASESESKSESETDHPVRIGATQKHFVLNAGDWTIALRLCEKGQYPNVDHVLPREPAIQTRIRIDPEDAKFLAQAIKNLPPSDSTHQPVTVDLNGHVSLRARGRNEEDLVELVLARSSYEGNSVQIAINRTHLERAVKLGFREIVLKDTQSPLVARDHQNRQYGWMPLSGGVLRDSGNGVRISSVPGESISDTSTEIHRSLEREPGNTPQEVPHEEASHEETPSAEWEEPRVSEQTPPAVLLELAREVQEQLARFDALLHRLGSSLDALSSRQTVEYPEHPMHS